MTILQQVNYVLITRHDFEAYARNPHGLMELGFRDPQLHTTVLPQLLNLPILRTFLAPLLEGIQTRLTLRASLNGIALDHRLVGVESGYYLSVNWEGSPHLVSQIEHMAISHTHSSCTDTLRYSPAGTSIHTYSKTAAPQCIYREAIGLSSAGKSTLLGQTWSEILRVPFEGVFRT